MFVEDLMMRVLEDPNRQVVQQNLNHFLEIYKHYGFIFSFVIISKIIKKVLNLNNEYSKIKSLKILIHCFAFTKHTNEAK